MKCLSLIDSAAYSIGLSSINLQTSTIWLRKANWNLKSPYNSIGGFEWISINLSKSAAFSFQTSENNLKPP